MSCFTELPSALQLFVSQPPLWLLPILAAFRPHVGSRRLVQCRGLTGRSCPRCKKGILGVLSKKHYRGAQSHQCHAKGCQAYVRPWDRCPVLSAGRTALPIRDQVMNLFCLTATNSVADTVQLTGHSKHSLTRARHLLLAARKVYVQQEQRNIIFGTTGNKAWPDVEVDETTFGKQLVRIPKSDNDKAMVWENWIGLVARGHPATLVLERLKQEPTKANAPWPRAHHRRLVASYCEAVDPGAPCGPALGLC